MNYIDAKYKLSDFIMQSIRSVVGSDLTGLKNYKKSKYCSKNVAKNTFNELIKNANFKYIFLSYNNEGLMTENEIKTYYRNRANTTIEYLHVLEKQFQ